MYYYDANRGFWVPFLIGGLAGGAAVGLSRPRPVYTNQTPGVYQSATPYYNTSYSYYEPMPHTYYY